MLLLLLFCFECKPAKKTRMRLRNVIVVRDLSFSGSFFLFLLFSLLFSFSAGSYV